jgi:hypothetical protein
MSTLRKTLLVTIASALLGALPAAGPLVPAAAAVYRVSPAVLRIVRTLHRMDIPDRWRCRNWIGHRGEGSCVHASMVHLLHWQGQHPLARWWQQHYSNGETAEGLAAKLDAAGIRYAETRTGDTAFLEWALRTRRGAAVVVLRGAHMVNLVGLDRDHAHLLDSNAPDRVQRIGRDEFLQDWIASGGWAVTPLGAPMPPAPWIVN